MADNSKIKAHELQHYAFKTFACVCSFKNTKIHNRLAGLRRKSQIMYDKYSVCAGV